MTDTWPDASAEASAVWPGISWAFCAILVIIASNWAPVIFGLATVVKYWYIAANQSKSVGSSAILPFQLGSASWANEVGGFGTRFLFQAITNISSRSAVKSSNRYCFGICDAYGDRRYGTSRLRLCWKISIVVPSLSTTSAPFVPAEDSERKRVVTSALAPR